jgi:predicted secreted Zn-dependent protease
MGNAMKRQKLSTAASALVMAVSCLAWGPASAEVTQVINHYDVGGSDIDGLKNSIRLGGPMDGRAFGLTNAVIEPRFAYVSDGVTCRTARVSVNLDITMILPQWREAMPIPASMSGQWETLEDTVREHEMTHVKIAQEFAARIEHVISTASSTDGCEDLSASLIKRVRGLQAAHRFAQKAFDMDERSRLRSLLP